MACDPFVLEAKATNITINGNVLNWNVIIQEPETPEFNNDNGLIQVVDTGLYLISASLPIQSDCGLTCYVTLKINGALKQTRTSSGGSRTLQFVYLYDKQDNNTDNIEFTFHANDQGSFSQNGTLRIEKDYPV